MAGYNRGIVATRKLNEKNKARLRATGDTEFGFIKGRLSHINKDEKAQLTAADAYDISLREKVEADIADKGAGTINPFTGMPEYHWKASAKHMADHAAEKWNEQVKPIGKMSLPDAAVYIGTGGGIDTSEEQLGSIANFANLDEGITKGTAFGGESAAERKIREANELTAYNKSIGYTGLSGRQDYDTLSEMTPEQLEAYLKDEFQIGEDSMQYIEGFSQEPFGFLGEAQALTTRGLESAYGDTMGGLGRTAERGFREAGRGRDIATSKSGLATSGTITQAYETQKKDLFQDYTAGTKTAFETLALGKEGAGLDFRTGEYEEKKRQLDQMYADIVSIP